MAFAQVSVQYTFFEPTLSPPAVRSGDECLVPVESLQRFGWLALPGKSEIQVRAEGQTIRLRVQQRSGVPYISLNEAVRQLGGFGKWVNEKRYQALGVVRSIQVAEENLRVETSLPVDASVFTLDAPPRLVLDLRGAMLSQSAQAKVEGRCRFSQFAPDVVRVVLDLDAVPTLGPKPKPGKSLAVSFAGGRPITGAPVLLRPPVVGQDDEAETVLRIPYEGPKPSAVSIVKGPDGAIWIRVPQAKPSEEADGTAVSSVTLASATIEQSPWGDVGVRLELRRPMGVTVSPNEKEIVVRVVRPRNASLALTSSVLFVDAGHGGSDPGAQFKLPDGTVISEKSITLPIAQEVSRLLTAEGATSVMTRDSDFNPGLYARAEAANNSNAHFFVSIHVNSNTVVNSMSGSFVYYHADDMDSRILAECIAEEIGKVSGLPNHGARSDYTLYPDKGLAVLRTSQMPAVLVEVAYLNHEKDRKLLLDPAFQKKIAEAIVRGIKVYLGVQAKG
jgi:N-acetylmuramoyl-L-alanine amidase